MRCSGSVSRTSCKIGELRDLAVGIAGDVHDHSVAIRRCVEPMNRHDRKQLAERPVIEQRLENREIADVLVAEGRFELLDFLGNETQAAMHVHDLLRELPVDGVDLRF